MEQVILELVRLIKDGKQVDDRCITALCRAANKGVLDNSKHIAKKKLFPFYLKVKSEQLERWESWGIDPQTEQALLNALRAKPRRTASGVATITVITCPRPCSSDCLYCPNDLRMPKSYVNDEPACRRAERNFFDPYLQVASRLITLEQMGHVTDKIELIVLGGTWTDYPHEYQNWFMTGLFKALNDDDATRLVTMKRLHSAYVAAGAPASEEACAQMVAGVQERVASGELTYNQGYALVHDSSGSASCVASTQTASEEDVFEQHRINEDAAHRVVGLVVETRPETLDCQTLKRVRRLGCTKVQIGVQSLDNAVLAANKRSTTVEQCAEAFKLLRLFGFKIHSHFMANLYGSSIEQDAAEYRRFASSREFSPDEIKLYPCALIGGTALCKLYETGEWQPYDEDDMVNMLVEDILATQPFTRVSRMIRDFTVHDIVAGSKKTNMRQMVESRLRDLGLPVQEIRFREPGTEPLDPDKLRLDVVEYDCVGTRERFLQWVDDDNRIAGFLRLSLPDSSAVESLPDAPVRLGEAMIREVHVYGKVASIHHEDGAVQHMGLGRRLVERACQIARAEGYGCINVISSVGTRNYYRKLGFEDGELYQSKVL